MPVVGCRTRAVPISMKSPTGYVQLKLAKPLIQKELMLGAILDHYELQLNFQIKVFPLQSSPHRAVLCTTPLFSCTTLLFSFQE